MAERKIRIGTRASKLALAQADLVTDLIRQRDPGIALEFVHITTGGDRDSATSLAEMGGQGQFTKAIEQALLDETADIAVHSAKDLPSRMTDELTLAAVPKRESCADVLISRNGRSLAQLDRGAVVGTGSPRRTALLLHMRSGLTVRDIRGNVETRLRKMDDGEYDGLIMAHAGLLRLGLEERATEQLDPDLFVPAPGQGALAVQTRATDQISRRIAELVDDAAAHRMLDIERALLAALNAGCSTPVGGYARIEADRVRLSAVVLDRSGQTALRADHSLPLSDADSKLVHEVTRRLLEQGAQKLIAENG